MLVFFLLIGAVLILSMAKAESTIKNPYDHVTYPGYSDYPPPSVPQFIVTCVNDNIYMTITNQPFVPFFNVVDTNGNEGNESLLVSLFYDVQFKGQSDSNWTDIYPVSAYPNSGYPTQSNSNYTTLSYSLSEGSIFENFSYSSQVDFQVQAMVGTWVYEYVWDYPVFPASGWGYTWIFYGTFGNWSRTQTITLENGAISTSLPPTPAPTLTPTITPTVPEFPSLLAIPIVFIAASLSIAVLVKIRKSKVIKAHMSSVSKSFA